MWSQFFFWQMSCLRIFLWIDKSKSFPTDDLVMIWYIDLMSRAHICHKYHKLYLWRKNCHVEKFWQNFGKFWEIIEKFWGNFAIIYTLSCGKNWTQKYICGEKMTNMRSGDEKRVRNSCFENFLITYIWLVTLTQHFLVVDHLRELILQFLFAK